MRDEMSNFQKSQLKFTKAIEWSRLIVITGTAQIGIQVVGMLSGLFIVRFFSPSDYALYTLANTMLGAMVVLSDSGISTGVMSEGGKVWQDRDKLGIVLATGLSIRRKFALITVAIFLPLLIYLLVQHGASFKDAIMITVCVMPTFFMSVSGGLLQIVPRLHQQVEALQKIHFQSALARFLLTIILVPILPIAPIAIIASALPQYWINNRLKSLSNINASQLKKAQGDVKSQILKLVKRMLPDAVYYCLSGQLTIWLLIILSNSSSIAQIGAIGRYNAALAIISTTTSTLIVPRFARLKNTQQLFKYFGIIQVLLIVSCVCITIFSFIFKSQLLQILGEYYTNLANELMLSIAGGCLTAMVSTTFALYTSRGFSINPAVLIPINLLITIIGVILFDCSELKGVLMMNIFVSGMQYLIHLFYGAFQIKHATTL